MNRMSKIALAVRVFAFVAVALFAIAAAAYPGGSYSDRGAVGHDFWRNSLCDVARGVALGGAPNDVGAGFARAAMTAMSLALGAFFWIVPEWFRQSPRLGGLVRLLGPIAAIGAIAVTFLPTDRFSHLHGLAIVAAGIPGLVATGAVLAGLVREPRPAWGLTALGFATAIVAAGDFAFYVDELARGGPSRLVVPVCERLASLGLLAWMVAATRRLPRSFGE